MMVQNVNEFYNNLFLSIYSFRSFKIAKLFLYISIIAGFIS